GYETYHHGKRGNTALRIQEKFDHNKYLNDDASRTSGEPGKEIADDAIEFLRKRNASKPYFMYLAFSGPHDPRVAAKRYMDLYQRDRIPLPRNYAPLHPFDNGEQLVRDELLADFPRSEAEVRKHLHDYWAVMTALDGHIGRILEHVDLANTLIVYSADHGLALGSHGLMGKQSLYDAAMKPPLIFSGPGIPRNKRVDALAYLLDIFPTVVDLAGATPPSGLDGKSLRPVLEGRAKAVRDTLFLSYRDVQRAVRDKRWKLIRYPQINRTQLFDLARDPDEIHDLSGNPRLAGRVDSLMQELARWQKDLGDTLPLTASNPKPAEFPVPPEDRVAAMRKALRM
ncbi:MAG: sulfatase-like hydrolase/transferase, partial [Bryobacteraceae bacterium]